MRLYEFPDYNTNVYSKLKQEHAKKAKKTT